jgi:hypothetical protein
MATNRDEFKQLMLQVERDLLSQTHLRDLLSAADATVARHRRQLRTAKSRLEESRKRTRRARPPIARAR